MPIVREHDWKRDDNDSVPLTRITDPDELRDWYNQSKYTKLLGRFKCDVFDCIIRNAYLTELGYTRKGRKYRAEVLHLICFVRNSMNYLDVSVFCRNRIQDRDTGGWGDWSRNFESINDFCEIVCRQKENYLDHYSYTVGDEERISYPHMCGVKVKIIATVKEQKTSSTGKFYDSNKFAIFDPDCHSGWELKNGIKEINDYVVAMDKMYEDYIKFCEDNNLDLDIGNPLEKKPKKEPSPVEAEMPPSQKVEDTEFDEDLPF